MASRDDFIAECLARPDDMTARHAFADWLEEQGESEEADLWRKSKGTPVSLVLMSTEIKRAYAAMAVPAEIMADAFQKAGLQASINARQFLSNLQAPQ